MRPATCGVTVTDSKAAFLPISSKYLGTSCAVAFTTVTSGGGMEGAACTRLLLHAAVVSSTSTSAAAARCPFRKVTSVFTIVFIGHPHSDNLAVISTQPGAKRLVAGRLIPPRPAALARPGRYLLVCAAVPLTMRSAAMREFEPPSRPSECCPAEAHTPDRSSSRARTSLTQSARMPGDQQWRRSLLAQAQSG